MSKVSVGNFKFNYKGNGFGICHTFTMEYAIAKCYGLKRADKYSNVDQDDITRLLREIPYNASPDVGNIVVFAIEGNKAIHSMVIDDNNYWLGINNNLAMFGVNNCYMVAPPVVSVNMQNISIIDGQMENKDGQNPRKIYVRYFTPKDYLKALSFGESILEAAAREQAKCTML